MTYINKYRTPVQLTGTARGAFRATLEGFSTARLFPTKENYALTYAFGASKAGLPPAAQYRSFNSESMVNTLGTGEESTGKLPPISIRMHVDEFQELTMYQAGDEQVGATFDAYAIANAQSIASRIAIAQADALVNGKVQFSDRDLNFSIDFGRKAALTSVAATLWGAAGSDPLADLDAAQQVLGKPITETWISAQIMSVLQRNEAVIDLVTRGLGTATVVSPQDVVSVFGAWGFQLIVKSDVVVGIDGAEAPLIDPTKVVLISGSNLGSTQLGVTAESIDPTNSIGKSQAPGLFSGAAAHHDPHGYNVFTTAIALPVANLTDNTATIKVL